MAYLTSCDVTNLIYLSKEDIADGPIYYLNGTTGIGGIADVKSVYRHRQTESWEYVGVTSSTASDYLTDHPSTTTYTPPVAPATTGGYTTISRCRKERDGASGGFKVCVDTETIYDLAT